VEAAWKALHKLHQRGIAHTDLSLASFGFYDSSDDGSLIVDTQTLEHAVFLKATDKPCIDNEHAQKLIARLYESGCILGEDGVEVPLSSFWSTKDGLSVFEWHCENAWVSRTKALRDVVSKLIADPAWQKNSPGVFAALQDGLSEEMYEVLFVLDTCHLAVLLSEYMQPTSLDTRVLKWIADTRLLCAEHRKAARMSAAFTY
jgi:hypothetical protein